MQVRAFERYIPLNNKQRNGLDPGVTAYKNNLISIYTDYYRF